MGYMQHIWRFIAHADAQDLLWRFVWDTEGQDVVEYGLLIATIAIVVLIGVGIFGSNINAWFQNLAARITTVGT
jgi:Flp pilus assembly pilin Flp